MDDEKEVSIGTGTKKRTNLSINKKLVEIAKARGINISRLAEDALLSRLEPVLSRGDQVLLEFNREMGKMKESKRLSIVPFKLEKLKLKNIKKFNDLELEFEPGINIVFGPNGSGKSTIIESIRRAFCKGTKRKQLIKETEHEGEIEVKFKPKKKIKVSYEKTDDGTRAEWDSGAILMDQPMAELDKKKRKSLWEYLKRYFEGYQIIMTSSGDEEIKFADNAIPLEPPFREKLEEEVKELRREAAELDDELGSLIERRNVLQRKKKRLKIQLENHKVAISELKDLLEGSELGAKKKVIKERLEDLREDLGRTKEKLKTIENKLDSEKFKERIGKLKNEVEYKKNKLEKKRSILRKL